MIDKKKTKLSLKSIITYVNPLARLGQTKYSFSYPLFTTSAFFVCIELFFMLLVHNSSMYSIVVIATSILLVLYFSFHDSFIGGFTASLISIIYFFYIIFSHQYSGAQFDSGVNTTIILGLIYCLISLIIGFLKKTTDLLIAQQMNARFSAEEKEKRIALILEQLPVGILVVNKAGEIIEGNKHMVSILGRRLQKTLHLDGPKSLFVQKNGKFLSPKEWPIARALNRGEVIIGEEMELVRNDNTKRSVRINASPMKARNNHVIGAVSTIYDITKEKEAEQATYNLAALVESSEDAIIGKNLDGIITSWNKSAVKLFGFTQREAIGKPITIIVPKNLYKQEEKIMKQIRGGQALEHFETYRINKKKKLVPVSMSISPIKDSRGKIIGAANITRDITRQKELENQKDNFIATASHELKTPITSLKGFTQVLQILSQRQADMKTLQLLGKMDSQLNKLNLLIDDLLDITKIQAGKLALNISSFDFDLLLRETLESMQLITETHTLYLRGIIGKEVYSDRDRLWQVLTNLIGNAIKYSPHAERVNVYAKLQGKSVVVSVEDFGIGIPKKKQKKIFGRFFQAHETPSTYSGLGLGLYISAEIVKRLHGTLTVKSKEGKGSLFTMKVPLSQRNIT